MGVADSNWAYLISDLLTAKIPQLRHCTAQDFNAEKVISPDDFYQFVSSNKALLL
jgi:hypothetical protein